MPSRFQLTIDNGQWKMIVSAEPTDYNICGAERCMAIPQSR